ncbi:MAG: hypothetical protein K2Y22_15230 [Candidatus Obscuribacterales bacterium]|nr:hypothetical protein [Candidatus Obscuribacterales bacterium]
MSLILTDEEYACAKKMLSNWEELFARYESEGATEAQSLEVREKLRSPSATYARQCLEEIAFYEQLKAGNIVESFDVGTLPRMLICFRIAAGLSQEEFAEKLGCTAQKVRTNEKNEYHGSTAQRMQAMLDLLPVTTVVVAERLDAAQELNRCSVGGMGMMLMSVRESQGMSYERLAERLQEEKLLALNKTKQDYWDCGLSWLDVPAFVSGIKEAEVSAYREMGMTTTTAKALAKALRIKLTVKAKLNR